MELTTKYIFEKIYWIVKKEYNSEDIGIIICWAKYEIGSRKFDNLDSNNITSTMLYIKLYLIKERIIPC